MIMLGTKGKTNKPQSKDSSSSSGGFFGEQQAAPPVKKTLETKPGTGGDESGNWFSSSSLRWNSSSGDTMATSPSTTIHNKNNSEPRFKTQNAAAPSSTSDTSSSIFSYLWSSPWEQANDTINYAADVTYSTLASAVSSFYKEEHPSPYMRDGIGGSNSSWSSNDSPPDLYNPTSSSSSSILLSLQRRQQQGQRQQRKRRAQSRTSTAAARRNSSSPSSLDWTSTLLQNPYQSVRRQHANERQSMAAIRSFITLVPDVHSQQRQYQEQQDDASSSFRYLDTVHEQKPRQRHQQPSSETNELEDIGLPISSPNEKEEEEDPPKKTDLSASGLYEGSWSEQRHPLSLSVQEQDHRNRENHLLPVDATAETAAHLAEGTIRAWRDLALEEAVELNYALRFWSDRWEQPGLSFLEAGPLVWLSEGGYNHRQVGKLVAQSQAVLARRCTAIGELQQHLLKAGWQRGVAHWGVLGQGGHWWDRVAPGFDGSILPEHDEARTSEQPLNDAVVTVVEDNISDEGEAQKAKESMRAKPVRESSRVLNEMTSSGLSGGGSEYSARQRHGSAEPTLGRFPGSTHESTNDLKRGDGAGVYVRNRDGGGTFVDDPLFLAKWSVDAIALVRKQLNRASNGTIPLPFTSNWVSGDDDNFNDYSQDCFGEDVQIIVPAPPPKKVLPLWAVDAGQPRAAPTDSSAVPQDGVNETARVMIADLPALTAEVSELLNTMEDVMEIQRERRLDRLQPPNWWRRNWYFLATSVPFALWLARQGRLQVLLSSLTRSVKYFFITRIQAPMLAIFDEIWKGRTSFSDKKARMESIDVLKKMIKSWLDDSYPSMPELERQRLADAMDVSLVEKMKARYMNSLGLNTLEVVRMSFIEMQWLKKEMMNALHAMDEVMSANDINMNLAAITPVFMIVYVQTKIIRYLFYAFLRIGKSREETYASFRAILLDIERLLVMRDDPPDARAVVPADPTTTSNPKVLGVDDLGMLMLLIHECRTIMWRERRRFTASMIRSVNEDLSELAGERGAVSIKQQLQIVARMTRSYPFLKVISTGHFFEHHNQLRRE